MDSIRVDRLLAAFTGTDLTELGGCVADSFLYADGDGARPVTRSGFLNALPERAELFARLGIGPAVPATVDCERLDDHYLLARTTWTAPRAGGEPVTLASSYLLHDDGERLRVVVYLNHGTLPACDARSTTGR
ncbi:hypothetical protein [Actinoplanes sp. NPDC049802]|uniref:hypothetical protein n=1 Tax=Actinoplanes sp. NPDC049802 TaxID=3154742 RepID=UPI0033F4F7B3